MERFKVLIIATTKFELDGITNVIINYYRAIDKSNMKIDFVIPNTISKELETEFLNNNSNIYILNNRVKQPFVYLNKLIKIIRHNKYDIVHAHGNSCTLAIEMYAAKRGGVNVRVAHGHNTCTKYYVYHKLLQKAFDRLYTHAFACGQKAGEWLYNGKNFYIINNGIEIDKYRYNNILRDIYTKKYGLKDKKVIGHIGHFSHQKNHEYLIDIFNELYHINNDYILMLVGDGALRKNIQDKVKALGLTNCVIFAGKTVEVPQLLQVMDILVMPSKYEGFPLTLVEAQSACLPCIISDKISEEVCITELVKLIPLDKSPSYWADQINKITIKNRDELIEDVCGQIVEANYSIAENAKRLKALYISFINK